MGVTDSGSYEGGKTTSFDFDEFGRERSMWVCDNGPATCTNETADREMTTAYFPSSATSSRMKPSGVEERLFFNNDGRAAQMTRDKNGNELKNRSYSYDPNGNRTTDERGTHLFNARDQLVQWKPAQSYARTGRPDESVIDYTVLGSGAIKKEETIGPGGDWLRRETFEYNGDRLISAEAEEPGAIAANSTYRYSADGFGEVVEIDQDTGEDTTYVYDDFARMVASRGPGEDDDTSYAYDGLDRRDLKTEPGALGVADEVFEYGCIGLSERLSREEDSGRVRSKGYDYDSQMRRLGQQATAVGQLPKFRSYAFDANGSVEGLEHDDGTFKEAGQAKEDRYRYDPYGQLDTAGENPEDDMGMEAKENPFRFEGFYYDAAIQTYDMQARPYRPDMGRFLTQDRFQAATGDYNLQSDPLTNNRYAFAGGNPVNNIEYDGHYAGNEGGAQRIMDHGGGNTPEARGETKAPVTRQEAAIPTHTDSSSGGLATRGGRATAPSPMTTPVTPTAAPVPIARPSTAPNFLAAAHTVLQLGGGVPVFGIGFDGADAGLYLAEGNLKEALTSGGAAAAGVYAPAGGDQAIAGARATRTLKNAQDTGTSRAKAADDGSEIVQRGMSRAELEATRKTGLIRGGRPGTHYVTDNASSQSRRARQRLALPQTPELIVDLQVPGGVFGAPSRVGPNFGMPGGGMERRATGQIPCRVVGVRSCE